MARNLSSLVILGMLLVIVEDLLATWSTCSGSKWTVPSAAWSTWPLGPLARATASATWSTWPLAPLARGSKWATASATWSTWPLSPRGHLLHLLVGASGQRLQPLGALEAAGPKVSKAFVAFLHQSCPFVVDLQTDESPSAHQPLFNNKSAHLQGLLSHCCQKLQGMLPLSALLTGTDC